MTKEQFARLVITGAVGSGVVDERAIEDAEGYDNGLTVGRLRGMAEYLYSELRLSLGEPRAELPPNCAFCGEPYGPHPTNPDAWLHECTERGSTKLPARSSVSHGGDA